MNEYLAEIIDAANEGIYVTDRDRRFLVWNKAAETISGYCKNDLIGRFCHDNFLCHTDLEGSPLCVNRCPLQAAIEIGAPKGPEILSVVSSFIELRDTNELWEVLVFHDVSAEKPDAALKVAGAAAHELRQPLQAIMILAGLISGKTKIKNGNHTKSIFWRAATG